MARRIRVVQVGLGPIGCAVAKLAASRSGIELVAALDIDPQKIGRDLGEFLGLGKLGIPVSGDLAAVVRSARPELAYHTTGSHLRKGVFAELQNLVRQGLHVLSTCEELSYPFRAEPQLSSDLDELARKHKVAVLATGINPGFLMDTWPLAMTAVCQEVQSIRVVRIQDATSRRLPFQLKIGAGLSREAFAEKVAQGTLRHVGLTESIALLAAGLGWELTEVSETIEPVMADRLLKTPFLEVQPGQAAGVRQVGRGLRQGSELITLEFLAAVGASSPHDAVHISGVPNLDVVIQGGTHGDLGTAAMVVNTTARLVNASCGLLTMKDIPIVTWTAA